jgi:hypothetical protein
MYFHTISPLTTHSLSSLPSVTGISTPLSNLNTEFSQFKPSVPSLNVSTGDNFPILSTFTPSVNDPLLSLGVVRICSGGDTGDDGTLRSLVPVLEAVLLVVVTLGVEVEAVALIVVMGRV